MPYYGRYRATFCKMQKEEASFKVLAGYVRRARRTLVAAKASVAAFGTCTCTWNDGITFTCCTSSIKMSRRT